MLKVIAKKKLSFANPNNRQEKFTAEPYAFLDAPEWIKVDPMFEWAKKSGVIEVNGETATENKPAKDKQK